MKFPSGKIFIFIFILQTLFGLSSRIIAQPFHYRSGSIGFLENKNQWDTAVLYKADIGGGTVFLEKKGFTFVFEDVEAVKKLMSYKFKDASIRRDSTPPSGLVNYHAYKMKFLGMQNNVKVTSSVPSKEYYNYFIGNDKSKWASKVRKYQDVTYAGLYTNTDLHVYESDFHLKYDYIIHPGGNPSDILLEYDGTDKMYIKDKSLYIETSVNQVIEFKPYAYQVVNGVNVQVPCKFNLKKNHVSFSIPDGYDKTLDLIIDPILIFSTYSGSYADNWGFTATYDSKGFVYAAGNIFGLGYPATTGAFQLTYAGGNCDIAITKYDTTGSFLIYATYLGGNGVDIPNSLIVNNNDELFLLGTTGSSDYPTTAGAFDVTFNGGAYYLYDYVLHYTNGSDIVISHFNVNGTALLGSTYVGGTGDDGLNSAAPLKHNYADEARGEIMIDANNNVYVVSSTQSSDFPVTSNAFQTTFGGGLQDACIFKIDNNLSNMIWSSYLGGSGNEAAYSIALDHNNDVYVCGGTSSTNFPTTPGVLHPAFMGGSCDGFISKINQNGSSILKSTYWGANAYDQTYLIKLDKYDNVHVVGQTEATGNTYIYNALWNQPNSGQFISKINPDLNTLIWSTAFGTGSGIPNISPSAFMVDLCNNIYLSGWGGAVNGFGGTTGMPVTPNAYQLTTDNSDYYFLVIKDDASAIVYGTFFGGSSYEHVDGGTSRYDKTGKIYQAVCAGCGGSSSFPTTPGAWSQTNNSSNCNEGVIKFDFKLPLVVAAFTVPPIGCAPFNAPFHNSSHTTGSSGIFFQWNFGDGTSSSAANPIHDYTHSGIYNVTLIVTDTGSCNLSDTVSHQLVILSDSVNVLAPKNICLGDFTQIGLLPLPDTGLTYLWIPSSNLSNDTIANPIASPTSSTDYELLISNGICTDTIKQHVGVQVLTTDAGPDTTICLGSGTVHLTAHSTGGATTFVWSTSATLADTLNSPLTNNTVTVNPTTNTTYYVQASNQSCSKLDSIRVNVSAVNILPGNNMIICLGDTAHLSVTNLNPSNPLNYQWSPLGSIISGANSSAAVAVPTSTTPFVVMATDAHGCQKKDTVLILVSAIIPNLVTDSVRCHGDCNGTATVNATGGLFPYTYQWSNGQSVNPVTGLCANSYSVTVNDDFGCQKVVPFNIYEPAALTAYISDTSMVYCDSVCNGFATVTVSGGTQSYHYSWIDGQSASTASNLCAGNYSVTVTDHNSCTVSVPINIVDTSNFSVTIDSLIPPLCHGDCNAIAFAVASGGLSPYNYNWDNSDHGIFADSLCAGNHNVMIFESGGCIRNLFYNITQPAVVTVTPTVVNNPACTGICDGSITVSASGGTPNYHYSWDSGQSGVTATNLCQGTYYVTAYDSHGCKQSDTITLTDPSPLLLNVTSSNVPCANVCNGVGTAFPSGSTPPYSYVWSNNATTNPTTNLCPGTYTVTVTDSHNCTRIAFITVHDSTTFPPNIQCWSDDTVIYSSQSTGIHTTVIPGYTYSWTPTTGLSSPSSPNSTASPITTTTYHVAIEDQYGCIYYDSVKISVIDVLCDASQIFVPNAFTPNGDNKNDIVYVRSNVMKSIYFVIYDRWGEKVFETQDLSQGWDGTYKGKPCDPGVFDYYMRAVCIDDKEFIKKGNITLIR